MHPKYPDKRRQKQLSVYTHLKANISSKVGRGGLPEPDDSGPHVYPRRLEWKLCEVEKKILFPFLPR